MNAGTMMHYITRINAIADIGLLYSTNEFDRERYRELKEICLRMLEESTGAGMEAAHSALPVVKDYPTVKVDIRGLVFSPDMKILMVQEGIDGKWSLPGGWAEIGSSATENITREVKEESGLEVKVSRLLAVFDKSKHPHPPKPFYIYKLVFLCEVVSGNLEKGHDLLDARFFSFQDLPALSEDRILKSQIELVVQKVLENDPAIYVD